MDRYLRVYFGVPAARAALVASEPALGAWFSGRDGV